MKIQGFVILSILATLISGCSEEQSKEPEIFPQKPSKVLVLPPEESNISRQEKTIDEFGTVLFTKTEYKDGRTSHLFHRSDGSMLAWKVFHPGKHRIVQKLVYFTPDETYLQDQLFRADGTLERFGRRLADGTYDIILYWEDGKSKHHHQIFSDKSVLLFDEAFRVDGSKDYVTRKVNTKIVTLYYDAQEKPIKGVAKERGGDITTTYFDENGEFVEMSVKHTDLETIVIYFDSDGNKLQRREFWDDRLFLDIYGENNKVSYRQRWIRTGGTDDAPEFQIDGLIFFSAEGRIDKVIKTIDLHSDGITTRELVIIHNPGRFIEERTSVFIDAKGRFERAHRQIGESGKPKDLNYKDIEQYKPGVLEKEWLIMPEPHEWPERVTPPLGHSDLEE